MDGEYEYEDDEPQPRRNRRRRSDRGIDLAASDKFGYRLLSNAIQLAAGAAGARAGEHPWVRKALEVLTGMAGSAGTGLAAAAAAALLQNPRLIKDKMLELGVPAEIVAMADEAIDSYIHGVAHAHTYSGKVTERDDQRALSEAQKKLAAQERNVSLQEAISLLPVDEQIRFRGERDQLLAADPANKPKFAAYLAMRKTARQMNNIIYALLQAGHDQWFAHLELTLGEIKLPTSAVDAVIGGIKSALKTLDETGKKLIAPPATGPDTLVIRLNEHAQKTRRRRGQ